MQVNRRFTPAPGQNPGPAQAPQLPSADWRQHASCLSAEPEIFFPPASGPVRPALKVCAGCPVRDECLAHALARPERHGVWGGMSERRRQRLLAGLGDAEVTR